MNGRTAKMAHAIAISRQLSERALKRQWKALPAKVRGKNRAVFLKYHPPKGKQ